MSRHFYRAFGLVISSDTPLASLQLSAINTQEPLNIDVRIEHGFVGDAPVVETSSDLMIGFADDELRIGIDEVGRFGVTANLITIQPDGGATAEQVQIYLLGSIIACLLYLRGRLPFHCNAIEVGGEAFLFCGMSGSGKSTLAAFLERRGYPVLTDDMCAIDLRGPAPIALAGVPRLKLWEDAIEILGRCKDAARPLPWNDRKWEISTNRTASSSLKVRAIYQLRDVPKKGAFHVRHLTELDAVNAVVANIYRRRVADIIGKSAIYLNATAKLVQSLPIYEVTREWSLERFEKNAIRIEEHLLAQVV